MKKKLSTYDYFYDIIIISMKERYKDMITCIIKHWTIYEVIRQGKPKMITRNPTQHMKEFMEKAKVTKIGSKTIYRL